MKLKRARRITGETPVIRQSSPKTRRILAFDDPVDPAPTCSRGLLPAAMISLQSPAFTAPVDAMWLSSVARTQLLRHDRGGEFQLCVVKVDVNEKTVRKSSKPSTAPSSRSPEPAPRAKPTSTTRTPSR